MGVHYTLVCPTNHHHCGGIALASSIIRAINWCDHGACFLSGPSLLFQVFYHSLPRNIMRHQGKLIVPHGCPMEDTSLCFIRMIHGPQRVRPPSLGGASFLVKSFVVEEWEGQPCT